MSACDCQHDPHRLVCATVLGQPGSSKEARRAAAEVLADTGDAALAGEAADLLDAAWDDLEGLL